MEVLCNFSWIKFKDHAPLERVDGICDLLRRAPPPHNTHSSDTFKLKFDYLTSFKAINEKKIIWLLKIKCSMYKLYILCNNTSTFLMFLLAKLSFVLISTWLPKGIFYGLTKTHKWVRIEFDNISQFND